MEDVGLCIIWPNGLFYGYLVYIVCRISVYFIVMCGIFFRFGILYQEKSGNPELGHVL
jgi:hypothetical protein